MDRSPPGTIPTCRRASSSGQAVAELFGIWRLRGRAYGVARRAFERIASSLETTGNALRGHSFTTSGIGGRIGAGMSAPADAEIGSPRPPAQPHRQRTTEVESDTVAASDWPAVERGLIGNAIARPCRAYNFNHTGIGAQCALGRQARQGYADGAEYLRLKGGMDALRSGGTAETDTIAQRGGRSLSANGTQQTFMDLMHGRPLAGADPSRLRHTT